MGGGGGKSDFLVLKLHPRFQMKHWLQLVRDLIGQHLRQRRPTTTGRYLKSCFLVVTTWYLTIGCQSGSMPLIHQPGSCHTTNRGFWLESFWNFDTCSYILLYNCYIYWLKIYSINTGLSSSIQLAGWVLIFNATDPSARVLSHYKWLE